MNDRIIDTEPDFEQRYEQVFRRVISRYEECPHCNRDYLGNHDCLEDLTEEERAWRRWEERHV